jgi:hypothetical protein
MAANNHSNAVELNRALLAYQLRDPVYRCPLSDVILINPVVLTATGLSYDRAAITAHLEAHGTDPMSESGVLLSERDRRLIDNTALRSVILGMVRSIDPSLEILAEIEGPSEIESEEPVIE